MTIAARPDIGQYQSPDKTNVTRSSPQNEGRRRRREHARRLRLLERLPRRAWEQHPLVIAGAVPAGSARAASQLQWLAAVRACPELAHLRADTWATTLAVAEILALHADWKLCTARPTWDVLMTRTGRSRSTIARVLARLRKAGLLGIVATGRSAGTDPMALDDGASAAVYVLAVPTPLRPTPTPPRTTVGDQHPAAPASAPTGTSTSDQPLNRPNKPGDKNDTPSLSPLVTAKTKPSHTRETKIQKELAGSPSPVRDLTRAELIAAGQQYSLGKKALGTKKGRLLAAAEMCRLDPVLGRLSVADIASLCREFFLAGYSPRDVLTALNTRPDGTPWPHDLTVAQIGDVRGWARYRLHAWRQNPLDPTSPPRTSPSGRAVSEQKHAQARAHARAEAAASAETDRTPTEDRSPAVVDALAAARALARANAAALKHPTP